MTQPIIGLENPLEDPSTGVVLHFHVLSMYQVDPIAQRSLVTFRSFSTEAAYRAGKNPVSATTVNGIIGVPEGDAVQWCYQQVLAADGGDWANAQAVHAEAAGDESVGAPQGAEGPWISPQVITSEPNTPEVAE